jgi:hypothetical protein
MASETASPLRAWLVEKLADSLTAPLPEATRRRMHGAVTMPGKATAVVGMRRSGKTTFLHQLRRERLERGVGRERLPYLDFEDERLEGIGAGDLTVLVDEYYRRYPALRGRETVTWCLDEIQEVPGWERFVRRLLDSEKVEVFLSGSSAALLSREIATTLRGRAWEVLILPFSFEEYLRHHGVAIPDHPAFIPAPERSALERALLDYLTVGGFPEAQGLDPAMRYRLLNDYVDVALLRDVVERYDVTNVASLRWLVRHLLGNPAGLFSVEKFHAALRSQGLAVSRDTLHELLGHLEDAFLVRTVRVESASERRRMVNPRKAYPVDPGLIAVFGRSGSPNLGHSLETAVRAELERRGKRVSYVRTREGYEVDFFARGPAGDASLIQVCADLSDPATREREVRALLAAAREHPGAALEVITLSLAGAGEAPKPVAVRQATEWFLTERSEPA